MGKTRFSMMAMLSASGVAGLLLTGAGCGSSGGSGGTGGTGGAHDGGGGTGGAHDAATGGTGGAQDAATDASDAASAMINFTFNTDTQGFTIDTSPAASPFNLGGGVPDGGAGPTLSFDSATGMPTPGSLHLDVTFTDFGQVVMVKLDYLAGSLLNLAGKTVTAQIRLDGAAAPTDAGAGDGGAGDGGTTATSSTFTGSAQLFVLTNPSSTPPGYFFAQGTPANLTDTSWHALTFNMASPFYAATGWDAHQITQIGVQLSSPPALAADGGGTPFGAAQHISVHIDTIASN